MTCASCGVRQERWRDKGGMERTNIDPISRLCIDCLAKDSRGRQQPEMIVPFDHKAAAAGRDDE